MNMYNYRRKTTYQRSHDTILYIKLKLILSENMIKKVTKILLIFLFILILLNHTSIDLARSLENTTDSFYGFIIEVDQDQSYNMQNIICKLINNLIQNDVIVYWLASDLSINSQDLNSMDSSAPKFFKKGSFMKKKHGITLYAMHSAFYRSSHEK